MTSKYITNVLHASSLSVFFTSTPKILIFPTKDTPGLYNKLIIYQSAQKYEEKGEMDFSEKKSVEDSVLKKRNVKFLNIS